jgi:hypothetical protein
MVFNNLVLQNKVKSFPYQRNIFKMQMIAEKLHFTKKITGKAAHIETFNCVFNFSVFPIFYPQVWAL